MGSDGGASDEASLTRPPLTSCCAARFLTGRGPVPVHGSGVGDPRSERTEPGRVGLYEAGRSLQ